VVLVGVGVLITRASIAWRLTGGPQGRSAIVMRGRMLGFWLGLVDRCGAMWLGVPMCVAAWSRDGKSHDGGRG
jgi:hypothetical protein